MSEGLLERLNEGLINRIAKQSPRGSRLRTRTSATISHFQGFPTLSQRIWVRPMHETGTEHWIIGRQKTARNRSIRYSRRWKMKIPPFGRRRRRLLSNGGLKSTRRNKDSCFTGSRGEGPSECVQGSVWCSAVV